ncbi:MAG: hypothetical protein KGZ25_07375, partial [Planctomycetes bacterium]|nr:hypothetical protein [Planctomycetota bacterium]
MEKLITEAQRKELFSNWHSMGIFFLLFFLSVATLLADVKSEKDRGDRMKSRAPKTPESVRISEDEKLGFEAFWEQYQDLLDQLAAKKLAIERKENDVDETRETGRKHHAELQKLVKER